MSINDIVDVSQKIGLSVSVVKINSEELSTIPFPVILYWKQEHFLVYSSPPGTVPPPVPSFAG